MSLKFVVHLKNVWTIEDFIRSQRHSNATYFLGHGRRCKRCCHIFFSTKLFYGTDFGCGEECSNPVKTREFSTKVLFDFVDTSPLYYVLIMSGSHLIPHAICVLWLHAWALGVTWYGMSENHLCAWWPLKFKLLLHCICAYTQGWDFFSCMVYGFWHHPCQFV